MLRILIMLFIIIGSTSYLYYFSQRLLTMYVTPTLTKTKKFLLWIIIVCLSLPAMSIFSLYATIYFHLIIISMLLEIGYVVLKKNKIYTFLFTTGLATVCIAGSILGYGVYNMHTLTKTTYTLPTEKIDTLRILQISDVHMSHVVTSTILESYCEQMSQEKADIIFLTGDIFDESTTYEDMEKACEILGKMETTLGMYYIYGNHDVHYYQKQPAFDKEDVVRCLEENNIQILEDTVQQLSEITIVGRSDAGFYSAADTRKTTKELLAGVDMDTYIIVLDHQPLSLEENASLGVDLQLSGHTHGGEMFPMRFFETLFTNKLVYGKRNSNAFYAITSSGVSGWGAPIRTGSPCEYVVIDIIKK